MIKVSVVNQESGQCQRHTQHTTPTQQCVHIYTHCSHTQTYCSFFRAESSILIASAIVTHNSNHFLKVKEAGVMEPGCLIINRVVVVVRLASGGNGGVNDPVQGD